MKPAVYAGTLLGMLMPLLLWGSYFLFVYTVVAVACAKGVAPAAILPLLWVSTLATFLAILLLGWGFHQRLRKEAHHPAARDDLNRRLNLRSGLWLSIIAAIATLWTTLAILYITPCD